MLSVQEKKKGTEKRTQGTVEKKGQCKGKVHVDEKEILNREMRRWEVRKIKK